MNFQPWNSERERERREEKRRACEIVDPNELSFLKDYDLIIDLQCHFVKSLLHIRISRHTHIYSILFPIFVFFFPLEISKQTSFLWIIFHFKIISLSLSLSLLNSINDLIFMSIWSKPPFLTFFYQFERVRFFSFNLRNTSTIFDFVYIKKRVFISFKMWMIWIRIKLLSQQENLYKL